MTLSKTLEPKDYDRIIEIDYFRTTWSTILPGRFDHQHRSWEYGLALHACRNANEILDVGGGGSIFSPAACLEGHTVHQVDVEDSREIIANQNEYLGKIATQRPLTFDLCDFMKWQGGQYDAVTCLSVIEHVPNDAMFVEKLITHLRPGGILVLTTDFSLDGAKKNDWHLRTYNQQSLFALLTWKNVNWLDGFDYTWHGEYVHNYTFASAVLMKSNHQ